MARERYDAVVVGAGPGGAATAMLLARGGAKVLLCDRSSFPRDKTCGGGLTPRGVGALERLGV
ncbi:MAG TPA: FAD-dependent monooxygenase, partial [Gaiellales bacterium]|nr:FAD-dependent monooxygenase [Gaiellales bacterium]